MKKKNFVSLLFGTVGGILFALGMCMCLLPEWGAFTPGVVIAAVGAVVLLVFPTPGGMAEPHLCGPLRGEHGTRLPSAGNSAPAGGSHPVPGQ